MSAHAAAQYRHYAPYGHFRAWALLRLPKSEYTFRLAYPTLICASVDRAFLYLYDVRTGSLMQTIDIHLVELCSIDINGRYAFVCEPDEVHVFSLESSIEVLRIHPRDIRCSQRVEDPFLVSRDRFITPLSVIPGGVDRCPQPKFLSGMFIDSYSFNYTAIH